MSSSNLRELDLGAELFLDQDFLETLRLNQSLDTLALHLKPTKGDFDRSFTNFILPENVSNKTLRNLVIKFRGDPNDLHEFDISPIVSLFSALLTFETNVQIFKSSSHNLLIAILKQRHLQKLSLSLSCQSNFLVDELYEISEELLIF